MDIKEGVSPLCPTSGCSFYGLMKVLPVKLMYHTASLSPKQNAYTVSDENRFFSCVSSCNLVLLSVDRTPRMRVAPY